ncbi:MAG: BLUF domain-containing protein [Candidatus Competibacterales bacterium]
MAIYQLVYASQPTTLLRPRQIGAILSEAVANNQQIDVTGMLLVGKSYFFQCLEGEEKTVEALYAKIAQDSRHREVIRLHSGNAKERLFREWSMKLFPSVDLERQLAAKIDESHFIPAQLTQGQVERVLHHISTNREAVAAMASRQPKMVTAPPTFWHRLQRWLTFSTQRVESPA